MFDPHGIDTPEQLEALLGEVAEAALKKEVDFVHPVYRQWIEAAPFAVLATTGPDGLDASPRGDPHGFVAVLDEKTLALPERRGNNRVDSLRNILFNPHVALLFLIPGVGETLRVNGRARITTAREMQDRFAVQGVRPKFVVVIDVDTVFFQCARAIHRSGLWKPPVAEHLTRVPSAGMMLTALTNAGVDGQAYDQGLPERLRSTLY